MQNDFETIFVGAGPDGLALAVALMAAGRDDFTLLAPEPVADPAGLVAAHDLGSYIKAGAALERATWLEARGCWEIAIAGAQILTARCLVDAGAGAAIGPGPRRFVAADPGAAPAILALQDALDAAETAARGA